MSDFDVYHKWLGIPPTEQPPNHYRLLGIALFEKDRSVIIAALDQRQLFLQKKAVGPQGDLAEPLLEHLHQARLCLLNRLTKAQYDSALRQTGVTFPTIAAPNPVVPSLTAPAPTPQVSMHPVEARDQPIRPANEFQFPGEADIKDVSAIARRMKWRSRFMSWGVNLIVLGGVVWGSWWLMERGFLPQLKALLQPANDQHAAKKLSGSERDNESANSKPPADTSESQTSDRKPTTKSVVVKRPSKTLEQATDTERFARHRATVADVALSADGRKLATAGSAGDCRVWDVTTGQATVRFSGHSGQVHAVALSPDGNQVVSSAESLKLWNAKSGDELAELKTSRRPSRAIQFWHNGQEVATAGAGAIEIWDIVNRRQVRMISGIHSLCGSLARTEDSLTLAATTGEQSEVATLFDTNSGKTLRSFTGHRVRISSIALSKGGTSLWTASGEHIARRWDTQTGTTQAVFAHADVLALSPDDALLATGGLNGLVSIWNAQTGSGLMQLPRQKLRILDIAFLPNGEHLLISGESTDTDGQTATLQLWQLPKIDPHAPGTRPNPIPIEGLAQNEAPPITEPTEFAFGVKKLPPPSDDQRAASKKLVREIFQKDFAKAQRPQAKIELAARLFEQAKTTTDDPAGQFVLLVEANDLAIAAGDVDATTKILNELTTKFDVDSLDLRNTTLRKLNATVKSGDPQERLAEAFLKLAEDCATASQFDMAIEAAKAATLLAVKAKNLKLRDTARNRTNEYLLKKKS